ncbi:unnamed protein product [Mycetohabitans rhizoxinica HKI 454]|uniref:Uncharacterized protein n=1 Tax=Mycetohabitans rhizoxinica (strain DSM 19002 / CIP 109453 / HKI 454) TaxID=882378 RepID=E5ALY2_MYCRK|nr:unnamed protein product [Mycetohabitans rhizoxinica HKI 454]
MTLVGAHAADVRARHTGADRDDPAARGRARPFCRDRQRLANLDVAWVAVARSTSYAAMRPSATRCTARNGAPRGLSPAAAYRQPARRRCMRRRFRQGQGARDR